MNKGCFEQHFSSRKCLLNGTKGRADRRAEAFKAKLQIAFIEQKNSAKFAYSQVKFELQPRKRIKKEKLRDFEPEKQYNSKFQGFSLLVWFYKL